MRKVITAFILGWALVIGGSVTASAAITTSNTAPHYDVTATLDYKKAMAQVTEKVTYVNQTEQSLNTIAFTVVSHAYGAFRLDSAKVAGATAPATIGPLPRDATLEVTLVNEAGEPASLAPNATVVVEITFRLDLAQQKNIRLGRHDHVITLANWLPTVQVFDDETDDWPRDPYIETGDAFYSEVAQYDIDLTVTNTSAALTLASSGTLVTPRVVTGTSVSYVLEGANMREFAVLVSERYQTMSTMVGDTKVIHYYVPKDAKQAQAVMDTTVAALKWGNEHLGIYPYPTLTVAESMDGTGGGQEYSALFTLASGDYNADKVYFNYLIAHETMHQWFYGMVGNNQVTEGWMDESLATFLGYQFVKLRMAEEFPTIWANAVVGYYDSGVKKYGYLPLDSSIYDFVNDEHSFRVSYRQGAIFQDAVMTQMGEGVYYAMMQDYVADETYDISTSTGYLKRIIAALGGDTAANRALIGKYFSSAATAAAFAP